MKAFRLFSFVFMLLLLTTVTSFSQIKTTDSNQSLSEINWDEEVSEMPEKTQALSEIDWDEEEPAENAPQTVGIKELDKKPPFSHWLNGFLFLFYLSGCFVTAFVTRNKAISIKTPPEFLIILHIFWPLELLLIPFFKK